MYTLKTIADWHPTNVLIDFVAPALKNRFERVAFLTLVAAAVRFKPTNLSNKRFLSAIENYICKRNPRADREFLRECLQNVCEISEDQFKEIGNGHSHVYLEGNSTFLPNAVYAKRRRIVPTFLDAKNPFYWDMLFNGESDLGQSRRENFWVSKIKPEQHINNSLLIVGGAHARNEYGLVNKLGQKGIRL